MGESGSVPATAASSRRRASRNVRPGSARARACNQRIRALLRPDSGGRLPSFCECGMEDCRGNVWLTLPGASDVMDRVSRSSLPTSSARSRLGAVVCAGLLWGDDCEAPGMAKHRRAFLPAPQPGHPSCLLGVEGAGAALRSTASSAEGILTRLRQRVGGGLLTADAMPPCSPPIRGLPRRQSHGRRGWSVSSDVRFRR